MHANGRRPASVTPANAPVYPNPAVAGASDAGPGAGASFSDGPEAGSHDRPDRVRAHLRGRDAHGDARREVEAAVHDRRGGGSAAGEGHLHHPPAVVWRARSRDRAVALAGDVDVHEVEGPVGGEGHPERVVAVRVLAELGEGLARDRGATRFGLARCRDPGDGRVHRRSC